MTGNTEEICRVCEPETRLDTEVVVLIERETLGGGVDEEIDDDWAPTVGRKAKPRKTTARERVRRRPTMAMVVSGWGYFKESSQGSVERNGDKRPKESNTPVVGEAQGRQVDAPP